MIVLAFVGGALLTFLMLLLLALVLVKPLEGKSRWQSVWAGGREVFHHWPGSTGSVG